jgi:hypothetical protein
MVDECNRSREKSLGRWKYSNNVEAGDVKCVWTPKNVVCNSNSVGISRLRKDVLLLQSLAK